MNGEIQRRWRAREPVQGVAFLLRDSVRIVSGLHRGSLGPVVSLVAVSPEPTYVVETKDHGEVQVPQSALLSSHVEPAAPLLAEVQRWYSSRCDGDWEHRLGIRIETLDNPGWLVRIDLRDTPLEAKAFPPVQEAADSREWIDCRVENGTFSGAGGPHMLGAILEVFTRWVDGSD